MKTPICDICLREQGALCASCNAKLSKGEITSLDVEVSHILYKINEGYNISSARFDRALDLGKVVLVLTGGEVGLLIGRDGRVVSAISSALGRKVRIAQFSGDFRKTLADIIAPARLLGINQVWVGGGERMRIRIPKADLRELPVHMETLEPVLESWLGKPVEIVFE